jgi:hypothetical protein
MSDEMKTGLDQQQIWEELRKPFHPSQVTWRPGAVKGDRALALAYADLRAYMNRLDEVCGLDWSVQYEPWGEDRIICQLTIAGVTRSSTGETTNESERSEIGGTVAEAQAFKRASTMFGLGRYLYNLPAIWEDYDPESKQFTGKAKAKLAGILVQHYRRTVDPKAELAELFAGEANQKASKPAKASQQGDNGVVAREIPPLFERFNALGQDLFGEQWKEVCQRNVQRISGGKTEDGGELTPEQIQKLITGMMKLKSKRQPAEAQG